MYDADKELLRLAMMGISEECYCAGWMLGLEYAMWDIANKGGGPYGMGIISEEAAAALLELSKVINGWIRWSLEGKYGGPVYVPMDEWLAMVEQENAKYVATAGRGP